MCKYHKFAGCGDPVRAPFSVSRKLGKKRRWSRNSISADD